MNPSNPGFGLESEKMRLPRWPESVQLINAGYEYKVLEDVAKRLGVDVKEILPVVGISRSTAYRRRQQNRFKPEESNKLYRLMSVTALAERVLENTEKAKSWLTSNHRGLGGLTPLSLLNTSAGADAVKDELYRIEYSVYG